VFIRLQSCFYCSRRLRFPKVEDRREIGCFAVVSLGKAVVEHKAQRHFEGLLLPSLFIAKAYCAAHEVPKKTIVPHIENEMYIAV
jgi:hypothetical protein